MAQTSPSTPWRSRPRALLGAWLSDAAGWFWRLTHSAPQEPTPSNFCRRSTLFAVDMGFGRRRSGECTFRAARGASRACESVSPPPGCSPWLTVRVSSPYRLSRSSPKMPRTIPRRRRKWPSYLTRSAGGSTRLRFGVTTGRSAVAVVVVRKVKLARTAALTMSQPANRLRSIRSSSSRGKAADARSSEKAFYTIAIQ